MEKFTRVTGYAAPMPIMNIDTDMIIPKQFLKTIKRTGLGVHLFDEMRYQQDGTENADFVLNKAPYRDAKIIVAHDNFGCGSSREHAPWSLADFGIKVIIAPSFADIFFNNCFKNSILPICMEKEQVEALMALAKQALSFTVDLETQQITVNDEVIAFDIEASRKTVLLEGLDDIASTLKFSDDIARFEHKQKEALPWLYE